MKTEPRILLAAPAHVVRDVAAALAGEGALFTSDTLAAALRLLDDTQPDLLVLSYVFDEMRPFRLLAEVESASPAGHLPILLLKATPVSLGETSIVQLREAYRSLGAIDFFDLWEESARGGSAAALAELRRAVRRYLERRRD